MQTPNEYLFEGRWQTMKEIAPLMPCLSPTTIKKHIIAGRQTRQEILQYNPDVARRAAGRRGSAVVKRMGFDRIGGTKTPCGARA